MVGAGLVINRSQVQLPPVRCSIGQAVHMCLCHRAAQAGEVIVKVTGHLSEGSLVRRVICPKGHLSKM